MIFRNKIYFSALAVLLGVSSNIGAQISYTEQNVINFGGFDESLFLGGNNASRTVDTEVADVNRDGFPDILDDNVFNFRPDSGALLRINNGDGTGFTVQSIRSGDEVSFDSHFADVNNDGYVDIIRSENFFGFENSVSVYLNQKQAPWFSFLRPDFIEFTDSCVTNIDVADVNNDGFIDLALSGSTLFPCPESSTNTGQANILLNDGAGQFTRLFPPLFAHPNVSTRDVFFLDANHDTHQDVVIVSENGDSFLYVNDGAATPRFSNIGFVLPAGTAGNAIDLNADGLVDFVIGGESVTSVYLNSVVSPGTFTKIAELPNLSRGNVSELELADYDVDGDVDILTLNNFGGDPVLWANNGEQVPGFTENTNPFPADFLPEIPSAEYIDFDLDGDSDAYLAGGEFDGFLGCLGCAVNRFFLAEGLPQQVYTSFEMDTGVWFQSTEDTNQWRFRWDRTSSQDTGPDQASSGRFYYYLETTVGEASQAGDFAILESPPLTLGANRYVVFDYHMYGSDIGSLHVDVFDGVQWIDSVWSISGQQQLDETNPWLTARVNLSQFDGEIRVRIRAVAIGGFRGDIAIDNLNVTNEPFAAPESVDTTIVVELPFDEFLVGGDLLARVNDEVFFLCDLSEIDRDGEICTISLTTAPDAIIELFVDLGFVFEDDSLFLDNTWFGCDERVEQNCRLGANGVTRNLELFQSVGIRN
ncbi:FG-GAP-like repeat-containing protein [Sessilibacter corallicola]|uniref:FG-GAP-like repeat-containing protein n=1 Tax=Sessilibacter corallicola TaxID=2904075 RepID=UPI001E3D2ED9|nr:FG-GAP-like repeat-containing protein [Sessilibacter corallicola]MCE2026730.1 FG-GAP-like repeat-containing protein [Sessilibacter corallicola]